MDVSEVNLPNCIYRDRFCFSTPTLINDLYNVTRNTNKIKYLREKIQT